MSNSEGRGVVTNPGYGNIVYLDDFQFTQFREAFRHKTENTKRAYTADLKSYIRYCEINHQRENLFLADEVAMCNRFTSYIDGMVEVKEYKKAAIECRLLQ